MKLFIHDLTEEAFSLLFPQLPEDSFVVAESGPIQPCIGCFGCWVKSPGVCVLHDSYSNIGELFSKCSYLVLISRCYYGGFSPFVKNILDRSISYLHPDFVLRNQEMHHRRRYENHFELSVCFYGKEMTEPERQTAKKLVLANARNLDCPVKKIYFVPHAKQIGGLSL